MIPNHVRRIWSEGGTAWNGWLSMPGSVGAEVMARQDWDSLVVDLQHGLVDYSDALTMLQAISQTDTVPLARAPWNEPVHIQKLLDAGAMGIICPMVNNREDAERFVGACRYAPEGYRSVGPTRAVMYAGADYVACANREVLAIGMVETAEALEKLDEILETPGLDAVYIGPSDLALSLGHAPRLDPETPEVMAAIERVMERARAHGVVAGIHTGSTGYALRMKALGFQLITTLSDIRMLQWAGPRITAALRKGEPNQNGP